MASTLQIRNQLKKQKGIRPFRSPSKDAPKFYSCENHPELPKKGCFYQGCSLHITNRHKNLMVWSNVSESVETLQVGIEKSRSLSENSKGSRAWGLHGERKARGGGDVDAHR
jgi:hypothetical protein